VLVSMSDVLLCIVVALELLIQLLGCCFVLSESVALALAVVESATIVAVLVGNGCSDNLCW
jgi:hypothetical protein